MKRISRRAFVERTGTGMAAGAVVTSSRVLEPSSRAAEERDPPKSKITLKVNGKEHALEVEDRWTLVEVLRDHLRLTGTKVGCDRGECGACTVLLDGKPAYSCSTLAVWTQGREITTVEGLEEGGRLDVLQEAFIEHDAPQCGFCTSGQLMAARALLDASSSPDEAEIRQALSGNLCRCANYNRYVEAVLAAARKEQELG